MKKLIILIALVAFSIFAGCGEKESPAELDSLAQCLTEKGAAMYGTEWCVHCKNQKKMFGDSFQYITFVDCDEEKEKCISAGIKGYPSWIIDGEIYVGEQDAETLASAAGC